MCVFAESEKKDCPKIKLDLDPHVNTFGEEENGDYGMNSYYYLQYTSVKFH